MGKVDGGLGLGSVIDLEVLVQRSPVQRHPLRDQRPLRGNVLRYLIATEHPAKKEPEDA